MIIGNNTIPLLMVIKPKMNSRPVKRRMFLLRDMVIIIKRGDQVLQKYGRKALFIALPDQNQPKSATILSYDT